MTKATRVQEQEKFINVVKGPLKTTGAPQIFKLDYGQFVESWFPGNANYICKCGSSGGGGWEGWGSYVVRWIYTPSLVWCL